ncbi:MAG: VanZ family protein [Terriglobales bacterium]
MAKPDSPFSSFLRAWWPAFVWIGIICVESSDAFSSNNTGDLLYKVLSRLFPNINLHDVLILNFIMRKSGHVIGYGILTLLLLRGWRRTLARVRATFGRSTVGLVTYGRTAILAWLGTVFVASMDEWHQSYIPSRTGAFHDVVLDSTAGLVFLLIAYFWVRVRERPLSSA